MSEPKYAVGDLVAVFGYGMKFISPKTVVTEVRFWPFCRLHSLSMGITRELHDVWLYRVAGAPVGPMLGQVWHTEAELRPYRDDDYTLTTEEERENVG